MRSKDLSVRQKKLSHRADRYLSGVLEELGRKSHLQEATVVLIGSAARGAETWRSDIDVLIVTPERIESWPTPADLHLLLETRASLIERASAGNDFALWATRYGQVKWDPTNWWNQLQNSPAAHSWPLWEQNLKLAIPRLSMAIDLLDMGDSDAAEEELLSAASQLARALMLRSLVFPLSRSELPRQLRKIHIDRLANLLELLLVGSSDLATLRLTTRYLLIVIKSLQFHVASATGSLA